MSTLLEIESAAEALPRLQQELLLQHLAAKLRRHEETREKNGPARGRAVMWPDYEGRLREIYGDAPMPSMIQADRE